ncbi:MAG TPA: hypothetical protein DCZ92_05425 [Elusimicrobia bacterium]|nr:MAG: hypothetical protein A2016_12520 [Elusimicrobia bacterium GWF2_62_30]HBA60246.1 hypothetical protein [Elusimicrobiota bacterium]
MAKKKILIVDDDPELGEEMAELLEAEGYSAERTSGGQGARDLLRGGSYDVFLLDFKMGDMTGLELLKEVRKADPDAAVFLVSGKPGLEALLEKENLAGAVSGIIEKPFAPDLLLEKLSALKAAGL